MFPSFFDIHDKFTTLPNNLLDLMIDPNIDPYDFAVMMMIARQTYGWRTTCCEISNRDFMKLNMGKSKLLLCQKKLSEMGIILPVTILDDHNQQHKIFFMNTEEGQKIAELCKAGDITYKELVKFRNMLIKQKKDPRPPGTPHSGDERPPSARNTHPIHQENGPRSPGEPLLKDILKAHIKPQQQNASPHPQPALEKPSIGPDDPDVVAFENDAWEEDEDESQEQDTQDSLLANDPDCPESPVADTPLTEQQKLIGELVACKVAPDIAFQLARQFPQACRDQLAYLPYREPKSNPGGYLVACIRGNYSPPPDYRQPQDPGDTAKAEALAAKVVEMVKPGQVLLKPNGHKVEVRVVRRDGVVELWNYHHRARENVNPEKMLALLEVAA